MASIASEKEKLEQLEQQHRATTEDLAACTDSDEAELIRQRSLDEQDAVDNQKFLVDNLEFQQIEVSGNISGKYSRTISVQLLNLFTYHHQFIVLNIAYKIIQIKWYTKRHLVKSNGL